MAKIQRRVRPQQTHSQPDIESAKILADALGQVSELPEPDQWPTALELLPDALLHRVTRVSRPDYPGDMMDTFGPLAVAVLQFYTEMDIREIGASELLTIAVYGVAISFAAELERRQHHFSTNVVHMEVPIDFDPEHPVVFIPKGDGPVELNDVLKFYQEQPE